MSEERVLEAVDDRRSDLIEFAQRMVSIPSENPTGSEKEVAEAIHDHMKSLPLDDVQLLSKVPERPNVMGTLKGEGGGKRLLFNGHTDVVPVSDAERPEWKADPYGAEIIDGELYGRGAADMKGPIASMLYAAVALNDAGAGIKGELALAFTSSEETGGNFGARYICEQGWGKADVCIIGEPSGMKKSLDYIAIACRGGASFKIVVHGTQMHNSQSDIRGAVNACLNLSKVLHRMSEELQLHYEPHRLYPQGPTINLADTLSGGVDYAIVPGYAEAKNDIRVLPGMSEEQVFKDLRDCLDKIRAEDPKLDVELVPEPGSSGWTSATELSRDHPIVDAVIDSTRKVMGNECQVGGFTGGTDAKHFMTIAGTPTIPAFGPGLLNLAHGPNERVLVEDLINASKVYALTALRYLQ